MKKRREKLNSITNSLYSLFWDDWGRDHEHFGGEWMIHTKKGTTPKGKYNPKFNVSKLWSILKQYCKVKNVGYNCDIDNLFGTHFITNKGEKVYITGGFLSLLEEIFEIRRTKFDEIIQHLEPIIITPLATEQPTNTKLIKEKLLPTFKEMFKDQKQFDDILLIIKPYLNETGALKVSPQGRYLQALYNVLDERGYLKNDAYSKYDNEQIANALNNQFCTNLKNDNFKPANRNLGDNHKFHFDNIPFIQS